MVKVRIDKAFNHIWYYSQIGSVINVVDSLEDGFYLISQSGDLCIKKSDCTVISDDTDQEEKEFVLPEKWCVSHCKEALAWIMKNAEIGCKNISKSNWYMFPNNKNMSNFSNDFPEGYTEITQDQFFAHVWEKEFNKEESKEWTPKVGEWVVIKSHYSDLLEVGKAYQVLRKQSDNNDCYVLDHCGELSWNAPYLYQLRKALPNEIPQLAPVIIAKAGEWVKIVDLGVIVNLRDSGFALNKPYELAVNLYEGGEFDVISDDDGDRNGFSKSFKIGMKFERCEAPVPVVQKITEPISEFIQKPTIGLLNRITHSEIRIEKIINAISSFDKAKLEIPTEWYKELYELSKFINQ